MAPRPTSADAVTCHSHPLPPTTTNTLVVETEKKTAQAADAADGLYNQVAGKVNNVIGSMMGDTKKEASGKAQETAGQAKKEANKPV
ncbi:hypothetical protein B0H13DRAFT_2333495 [Mycena leptocephala]|nr:hypothetical protein B0H13DRAFT_2333495 [Mycena leptocephala]